jgi:hypothetical protein
MALVNIFAPSGGAIYNLSNITFSKPQNLNCVYFQSDMVTYRNEETWTARSYGWLWEVVAARFVGLIVGLFTAYSIIIEFDQANYRIGLGYRHGVPCGESLGCVTKIK